MTLPDTVDPRVLRTRRVVLEAVLAELSDRGHAGFSIEGVAARAGVGKSTVYRHWAGKAELIAAALDALNVQPRTDPSAPPRERVTVLLMHLADALVHSPVGRCIPALIEAAEVDDAIGDLLHEYSATRRSALRDAVADGIAGGDFPGHLDADQVADALSGAVLYRRLMTGRPFTPDDVPALVASVLGPERGR